MADNFFANSSGGSSINPYASPVIPPQMPSPTPVSNQSIWRDGKRIVVLGPNFNFPPRCIKTGRTDDLVPKQQTVKFLKHGVAWMLMFGAIGAAIAHSVFGQTLNLTLPVSQAWLAKKRKHFLIGLFIALGGGALFALAIAIVIAVDPQGGEIAAFAMLIGMLIGLGGLIYMAAAGSVNLLSCNRMDGHCAWLDGAAPEFLAGLPEWSTTGPIGAPGVLRRS